MASWAPARSTESIVMRSEMAMPTSIMASRGKNSRNGAMSPNSTAETPSSLARHLPSSLKSRLPCRNAGGKPAEVTRVIACVAELRSMKCSHVDRTR
jgi:hypothetical protein